MSEDVREEPHYWLGVMYGLLNGIPQVDRDRACEVHAILARLISELTKLRQLATDEFLIELAIADPGLWAPPCEGESASDWATRAVMAHLAGHPPATTRWTVVS